MLVVSGGVKLAVKRKCLIEKRNVLNEIRANGMTLQELRFFSIYLAKINARDSSTRIVRFPILEFKKIMELVRVNVDYMMSVTNSLLCKVVNIRSETGGYKGFQLFKECSVDKDKNGEWYVEIDAHDEALPLMFEFKEKYFTYELWNALRLKSSNQLRMYEILKQYEQNGERIIPIDELKELLGLDKADYPRFNNFKARVLDSCQEALQTYTDIKFIYEPTGKKGKGGKIYDLKFTIFHNDDHIDQLSLDDFINIQNIQTTAGTGGDTANIVFENKHLAFLAEACNKEFNEAEMQILHDLIVEINPHVATNNNQYEYEVGIYDYLKSRYNELNWRDNQTKITNRFSYFKKMLEMEMLESR